jgi:two-component system sensor histidine kinase FlrB
MGGRGHVSIRIDDARGRSEGDVQANTVAIEVQDDGPGIPEELRGRVMEPFFTTKSRGGGLGLVIAQRTAEVHGGALTLICPDGGGTIARLTLGNRPRTPRE